MGASLGYTVSSKATERNRESLQRGTLPKGSMAQKGGKWEVKMKLHTRPEGQSSTGLSLCTVPMSGSDTIYQAPKYIYEQINSTRFLWKNNRHHHKNTVSAFQFQPAVPLPYSITRAKTAKAEKQVEKPWRATYFETLVTGSH